MARTKKVMVEAKCEFCSNIIQKRIEIEVGSERKGESVVDLYCPFCTKWVKGTVQGDLALKEIQARRDEQLRMFNLGDINAKS